MLFNLDPDWSEPERAEVVALSEETAGGLRRLGHRVYPLSLSETNLVDILKDWSPAEHVLLNWCEGIPGVDHSEPLAAQLLDSMEFVYTGSTCDALALCQDKPRTKERLTHWGVPVPRWRVYTSDAVDGWSDFPAIVKPAYEHGSIGVSPESVVTTLDELRNQVRFILERFSQPAVVEDFIDGREFHVALWGTGSGEFTLLPPVEMDFARIGDFHHRLCTYAAKFDRHSTANAEIETRIPANLSDVENRQLAAVCTAAAMATQCRDYARIDVRLRDGIFYVLDVNPNPDLSPDASMACAAETIGYGHPAMLSRLICLAAQRHPQWRDERIITDTDHPDTATANWFIPLADAGKAGVTSSPAKRGKRRQPARRGAAGNRS